jgi:hypothetical protein
VKLRGGRLSHRDRPNSYSAAMTLVRAELVEASLSLVLRFLAWLAEFRRWPRRVWVEACPADRLTGEGWREVL